MARKRRYTGTQVYSIDVSEVEYPMATASADRASSDGRRVCRRKHHYDAPAPQVVVENDEASPALADFPEDAALGDDLDGRAQVQGRTFVSVVSALHICLSMSYVN
jgi:hypothetical protein